MPSIVTARYFLVRKAGYSNKEALAIIEGSRLLINGEPASIDDKIYPGDTVTLGSVILKEPRHLVYIALNKPRGIETTMNKAIRGNLADLVQDYPDVFPVGRLDKESEGLLLLTNDGHLYKSLALSDANKEKEYVVTVDDDITEEQLNALASGIMVMGQMTKPATVSRITGNTFRIILTQGLNRQIRRMCYKLGLEVTRLIRTRIDTLQLLDLQAGKLRQLTEPEVRSLKRS